VEAERARLFVGLPAPVGVVDVVRGAQVSLLVGAGWRHTPVERLHVTLAFIGEVSQGSLETARESVVGLEGAQGGVPELDGFLFLPAPSRARVVALGFHDPEQVFEGLYEELMGRLESAGVMKREGRAFRPHLTIARSRRPVEVGPMSDVPRSVFSVESMCLYRSELRREGPVYTVVERIALSRS